MGNYERGWEMKEQFFFFLYTASSSGERRSVMSLAAGQELLLRIDTDNNTQCMNYIIALAFVITSLLSVLSFHLWISTLSALQQSLSGRKKKKKRNDSALPLNQVWKWFSFSFQDFGILMGLCSRSGLLMLFTESTRCSYLARSSRRQSSCDREPCSCRTNRHEAQTEELHAINNGSGLWKENSVGFVLKLCVKQPKAPAYGGGRHCMMQAPLLSPNTCSAAERTEARCKM